MIKLYGVPASRAFRALWMLRELGLEFENVPTSFANGGTRSAEFLKLNPNGHIPVLVDGSTVLWESMAINLYLARQYGAGSLWPATVADEGRAFQWSFWVMTEVDKATNVLAAKAGALRAQEAMHRVLLEQCSEGGMNLTDLNNGDWVRVVGLDFGIQDAKKFSARVASQEGGGTIELRLDSPDGKLIGTCKVDNTGGWQAWKSVSTAVSGARGVRDLCLKFTGGEKPLLNLDYWKFE